MSSRIVASPCLIVSGPFHASSDTEMCTAFFCLTDVERVLLWSLHVSRFSVKKAFI